MVKKYGKEEGTKKFNDYVEKQKETKSWAYMVEKFGEEEASRINASKYGGCGNFSKAANEFFDEFNKILESKGINDSIFYSKSGHEQKVYTKLRNYYLDFYIPSLNVDIEYYGDYYHALPSEYPEDFYFKQFDMTSKQMWERDRIRNEALYETAQIRVFSAWETDVIKNKKEVINKILKFLESNEVYSSSR